jgi:DNA-binding response OmpR family regulator
MNPPRVLIADDDEALLGLMVRRLTRVGAAADSAADGVLASTLIQRNEYDLIVSDINMPGKTGLELLQEAKQRDPHVQVVIVTGGATVETAVQALNQGAFGFLTKPFEHMSVLENAAARALEFRRLTLDNLRMAEVQKKRGDLLQDEVADRLKQVNRQDREMRQILATVPEGILIVGGRRAVVPYNPAAQRFQALDAQSHDHPLASFLEAARGLERPDPRLVSLAGSTLRLTAVDLTKERGRPGRVVVVRDLTEESREISQDLERPVIGLAQGLAQLLARRPDDDERETLMQMARQVRLLEGLRSTLAGPAASVEHAA